MLVATFKHGVGTVKSIVTQSESLCRQSTVDSRLRDSQTYSEPSVTVADSQIYFAKSESLCR